jgi:DNA repair exonuclease SbcCD ATPase subunit
MAKTNQAGADLAPATLEEAVALAQGYKEELEKSAGAIKTLEANNQGLTAELKKAAEVNKSLKSELKDASDVIEELKTQVAQADKKSSKGPIVKIGNKSYLVIGGTVIDRKPYKPEDLAADKELCKKLIEKGSTLLTEIQ